MIFLIAGALALAVSSVLRITAPTVQGPFLPDYLAHWTGGSLVFSSDRNDLYNPLTQYTVQQEAVGATTKLSWFVSPPIVAALYAPLAVIEYNLSGILWLVLSAAMLVWCTLSLTMLAPKLMHRKRRIVLLTVLASPPVFELLGGGQDSVFILAVWLIGIRLLTAGHPVWAGVVLGLGFAKPQLVILVPIILLATRNYRALVAFAATFIALLGVSAGLVGVEGLHQWVAALTSPLYLDQVQHGQAWKMVGLPSFVLALAPPDWGSWLAANLTWSSLPIGVGILLVRMRGLHGPPADTRAVWVSALATTAVFSPHLAIYDAVLFIPVVLYLLERRSSPFVRVAAVAAFGLMWLAPVLHTAAGSLPWPVAVIDAPWSALPLAAMWVESLNGLRPRRLDSPGAEPATPATHRLQAITGWPRLFRRPRSGSA
jgi:Glycosyltransferase family 87